MGGGRWGTLTGSLHGDYEYAGPRAAEAQISLGSDKGTMNVLGRLR